MGTSLLTGLVVVIALGFAFTNGFHDAANSVAASIATRAVTTRGALAMAAVLNLLGALLGTQVALTVGSGILDVDDVVGVRGLLIAGSALVAALAWNLATWWRGLPSSSSQALIGALAGAGLVGGAQVHWERLPQVAVTPMVLSPVIGLVAAWVLTRLLRTWLAAQPYGRTMTRFRLLEAVSSAMMALGHGLQDAQKTMGVILLTLVAGGSTGLAAAGAVDSVPLWVRLVSALALAAGTWMGGLRIIRTLGGEIAPIDASQGFVAQSVSAVVLYVAAFVGGAPVSTTYTAAAAITGAGLAPRGRQVSWGTVGRIAFSWLVTLPAAGAVAGLLSWAVTALV